MVGNTSIDLLLSQHTFTCRRAIRSRFQGDPVECCPGCSLRPSRVRAQKTRLTVGSLQVRFELAHSCVIVTRHGA